MFLSPAPYIKEVSLAANASSMKYIRPFQIFWEPFSLFLRTSFFWTKYFFAVFFIVAVATTMHVLIFFLLVLSTVSFINKVLHVANGFSIFTSVLFSLVADLIVRSAFYLYHMWLNDFFSFALTTSMRILLLFFVFLSAVSFINKVLHVANAFSIKYFCCFHFFFFQISFPLFFPNVSRILMFFAGNLP